MIHVGASTGQERGVYDRYGLRALWIEPIPEVFAELERNLAPFPEQRALCRLVTDQDGGEHVLHVASNRGESSSILPLARHQELWPDISFTRDLPLRGVTLATLLREEKIPASDYDALVLDVQGAELLVLRGARELLPGMRFLKLEAADFECYAGNATVRDLEEFLAPLGYSEVLRRPFAKAPDGKGACYDLIFARD